MAVQIEQGRGGRRFGPGAPAAPTAGAAVVRAIGRPAPVRAAPHRRAADAGSTRPPIGGVRYPRRVAVAECPAGSAAGPYRMGRWARLGMTIIVTAAVVVASLSLLVRPAAGPTEFVTVQPADTLVSIADRDMPGWDVADAIGAIETLNHVTAGNLQVGTVLRIPAQP